MAYGKRKQTLKKARKQKQCKTRKQKQRGSGFLNRVKTAFTKKSKVVPYVSSNITNVPAIKEPSKPINLVILTVKLELLDRSNNNNHVNTNVSTDEIIEWYEEHGFPVIESYGHTEAIIEHIKGNLYQIAYKPSPTATEYKLDMYAELIADVDQSGNYPIEKGRKTYLVAGRLHDVEFEYA